MLKMYDILNYLSPTILVSIHKPPFTNGLRMKINWMSVEQKPGAKSHKGESEENHEHNHTGTFWIRVELRIFHDVKMSYILRQVNLFFLETRRAPVDHPEFLVQPEPGFRRESNDRRAGH